MSYTPEDLAHLEEALSTVDQRTRTMQTGLLGLNLGNARAREFATHGLGRRLSIMSRCIANVFATIPPATTLAPMSDALLDANINLQAFIFNLFGAIDNLAWIWVHEKDVKDEAGRDLRPANVGLRTTGPNKVVLSQLPADLQSRLQEFDGWFKHLDSFRHSLGHRIPLYIPQYTVTPKVEEEYAALGDRISDALKARDFESYDRLVEQQLQLGVFQGVAIHSFSERSPPMRFHGQMLADFATIEDLVLRFVAALGGHSHS